ncbi:MAG: efflux RND transporter periplasmic adaptor subunit [Verrucomicrobiaceae bacterium]|nr:MAG: efflux RND transporter periplasmic adaptor subunit [Verrucomicrobiaceae bacterium]
MNPRPSPHQILGRCLAASLICLFAGASCSRKAPPAAEAARPVKTMVVSLGGDSRTRTFPGRVEASKQVELTFQVAGLIVDLPVREGQKVAKGDVIAQLRQDDFKARLAALQGQLDRSRADLQSLLGGVRPEERLRLEAQLRSAEATLSNARSEFRMAEQLIRTRAISRLDFERAKTAVSVAQEGQEAARQTLEAGLIAREEDVQAKEAVVRGLEGQVVEANLQLADSTLRAPYDGVIAQRFVEQGQNVRAQQSVVKFQDVNEIDIVVDVPEAVMMADLRAADILRLEAEFSAAPGLSFPVYIKEIAQRADAVTQTFSVRVAMKVPEGINLLPGMTSTVSLTYRRASILGGRILVPVSAIFKSPSGEQITWVLGSDQTVTRRPVTLGQASGNQIEVSSGLASGDRIAVAGVAVLREGMKVRDLGDGLGGGQP